MKRTPMKRSSTKMRRRTAKTAARDRSYMNERDKYLAAHPVCEHAFDMCEQWSDQIDHRIPRGLAPHRVDDPTNFIASCGPCHHHRTNGLTREERIELKLGIFADDYNG